MKASLVTSDGSILKCVIFVRSDSIIKIRIPPSNHGCNEGVEVDQTLSAAPLLPFTSAADTFLSFLQSITGGTREVCQRGQRAMQFYSNFVHS